MYISLIGILGSAIWGSAELFARYKVPPAWSVLASLVTLFILLLGTFQQVGHWHDSETLWNYTIAVTDRNFMAEDNLAQQLANQGRTKEALVHFHKVLALHDWQPSELIAFGVYEQRQGYAADAISQYQRALHSTSDAKTRAVELSNMGSAYMDLKDVEHAAQSFYQALQSDPNNIPALIGTGLIAQKTGNLRLAINEYTKAVSIKPSDLGYALLGQAFEKSGKASDAATAYAEAQKLSSDMESTRSAVKYLLAE
jgi:protein O-mannosyl-transferase